MDGVVTRHELYALTDKFQTLVNAPTTGGLSMSMLGGAPTLPTQQLLQQQQQHGDKIDYGQRYVCTFPYSLRLSIPASVLKWQM